MDGDISYSMMIDKNDKNNKINSVDKNPYGNIEKRKIYKWVDDNVVVNCFQCSAVFSFYLRKHHCRVCGHIFCYNCCSTFIIVPAELQINRDTHNNHIDTIPIRVCVDCNKKVCEFIRLERWILLFGIMNFDIMDLFKLRAVCREWRQTANYYLSKFREIQYYLSDHKYTASDKKMLWVNRKYIVGHNKWFVQLLKSVDYDDYKTTRDKLDDINDLLRQNSAIAGNKSHSHCWKLMCSRQCHRELLSEDCITLLNRFIKSVPIRAFVVKYLDKVAIDEMICYIPFLVSHIKYESLEHSVIGNSLIDRCIDYGKLSGTGQQIVDSKKIYFINEFYWYLRLGMEDGKNTAIYKFFIDKLELELNPNVSKLIMAGHNLINLLKHIPQDISSATGDDKVREYIKKNITRISRLTIPLNPILNNIKINISQIRTLNSYTKPLLVPLTYTINGRENEYSLLYKSEDIRKDKIIMNVIRLMDIIIKREEQIDLHIITYDIRPINCNSGILEIIPDCETIYNIREKLKFNIINYIMEHCPNDTSDVIRRRFMKSCAAYCVITYILGIGDRHLDNIMITKTGILFHIDYSFILGYNAKPFTPQMRITDDMVDALGGINSEYYIEFKNICNRIYNCLRRHLNLFIDMLALLADENPPIQNSTPFTREYIIRELLKRFIPGENNEQAELQLCSHIDKSSGDYQNRIYDFFHYHNKEHTIGNAVESIYNLFGKGSGK